MEYCSDTTTSKLTTRSVKHLEYVRGDNKDAREMLIPIGGIPDGFHKGKVYQPSNEAGRQFCRAVEEHVRKPRPLFSFSRVSFDNKVRILGRYGITDVSCFPPFETVEARNFKPEGCHIQLWLILREQVFPKLVGYSPELLHTFLFLGVGCA